MTPDQRPHTQHLVSIFQDRTIKYHKNKFMIHRAMPMESFPSAGQPFLGRRLVPCHHGSDTM